MTTIIQKRLNKIRSNLDNTNQRLFDALLFLLRFTLLSAPLYLLLWTGWDPVWLRTIDASVSSSILTVVGIDATSSGTHLITDSMIVDISIDSTGWKSMIAISALIIATAGKSIKKRFYGIVAGILVVFIGNIGRITSMVFGVEVLGISYDFVHTVLWRWGLTLLVFTYWLLWLRWETCITKIYAPE